MLKKFMQTVLDWLVNGKDIALATIISDSGSTPRKSGVRMAVIKGGSFVGTLGGGALEFNVLQLASEALNQNKSFFKRFVLSDNTKENIGMVCGGNVTVHIQYISACDNDVKSLFEYGISLFSQNTDSYFVTDITNEHEYRMSIYTENKCMGNLLPDGAKNKGLFSSCAVQVEIDGHTFFSAPLTKAGRTYIFGGGHVARELVPLLSHLGFNCFVFDNSEKFANKQIFPDADSVIIGDFENIDSFINIADKDYVIIMTRNHNFDFTIQAQTLALNPRYIGAIGSKSKVANITKRLLERGFSDEQISKIHMPIGLPILAETPAEIAVSIAAELIKVRAGKSHE